jgi:outer membrane immunogenic protein
MNKLLVAGIGLAGLIGGPALAADMRPPPAPVELFTWSGAYVGVNLGSGWRQPVDLVTTMPSCTDITRCLIVDPDTGLASALGTGRSTRASGATGGFQAGYNYQFGAAVAGVELDWEYFKRTSSLGPNAGLMTANGEAGFPLLVSNEVASSWLATIRGRLGFAWDRLLVYATGGVAFTDVRYTQTMTTPFLGSSSVVNVVTETKAGLTVGGGAEYALWNHLTLRAEYLYAQFTGVSGNSVLQAQNFIFPTTPFFSNPFTGSTGNLHDHIVRLGLNYKFGYGGSY